MALSVELDPDVADVLDALLALGVEALRLDAHERAMARRSEARGEGLRAPPYTRAVPLDVPETHRDLLDAPVAVLATIGDDGLPQVTAVWFLYADGELQVSLNETRQKTKNLLRRPECTLLVLDTSNTARYLEIRSRAEVVPDEGHALRDAVGRKYGVDLAGFDPADQRRYAVRLEPVRVRAIDMSAT